MINIRQSPEYALFMERLGWKAEQLTVNRQQKTIYAFIRQFSILGSFIKILRVNPPIDFKEIDKLAKKYRAFKIQVEQDEIFSHKTNKSNLSNLANGYVLAKSSLTPTKTILIDLTPSKEEIFKKFAPEKRRAVRRAVKNGIVVKQSFDIKSFINLKKSQLWPFGFLLANEIKKLWEVFEPAHKAILLLAYTGLENKKQKGLTQSSTTVSVCDTPNAGIFLLFYNNTAYYWLASSSKEGKKLFSPSLLVWEALKLSQKRGCKVFDFEGIEDKRFKETKSWSGFTKFKNGFGGKEITYISPLQKLFWPTL